MESVIIRYLQVDVHFQVFKAAGTPGSGTVFHYVIFGTLPSSIFMNRHCSLCLNYEYTHFCCVDEPINIITHWRRTSNVSISVVFFDCV